MEHVSGGRVWCIMMNMLQTAILLAPFLSACLLSQASPRQDEVPEPGELRLRDALDDPTARPVKVGTYTVWEDRAARAGRTIDLALMVIPARSETPKPDAIFYLMGGPGVAATSVHQRFMDDPMSEDRDIVLVDQRGTGRSHGLFCDYYNNATDLQSLLDGLFPIEGVQECLESLSRRADLTKYTTPIAMDDLNEVRQALGYEHINIYGGSYGTRAGLVYLRRHPETVRSAILTGVAPLSFTNPLYHASEAQRAIEMIFELCADDPDCHRAYPNLAEELDFVLARLLEQPARVTIAHPETGEPVELTVSRDGFAGALRFMMYYDNRDVPRLIHRAFEGDLAPFVEPAVASALAFRDMLAIGMLLCVTCAEDVARIDPALIEPLTRDTFLGDTRVRAQIEACERWVLGDIPEHYGDPVSVDVPVLLLSGTLDPVTSPRQGEDAARHLPNSLHVIAAGTHGVSGPCITRIMTQFLESPDVGSVDTSCVERMRLPRFTVE